MMRLFSVSSLFPCLAFLHVIQGIRISISPDANPAQKPAGQQLNLLCTIEDVPSHVVPALFWTKHGGIDKTGNVAIRRLDNLTLSLVIENSTVRDSGVYTCHGTTGGFSETESVDVIFFRELNFLDERTTIDEVPKGASLNVSCQVDKLEGERIITTWVRGRTPIYPSLFILCSATCLGDKYKFYEEDAVLEVQTFDAEHDLGEYSCRAFHTLSGSTATRNLLVGGIDGSRRAFCHSFCTMACSGLFTPNFKT